MAVTCKICYEDAAQSHRPFIAPCKCTGELQFMCMACFKQWRERTASCEMCSKPYPSQERFSASESIPPPRATPVPLRVFHPIIRKYTTDVMIENLMPQFAAIFLFYVLDLNPVLACIGFYAQTLLLSAFDWNSRLRSYAYAAMVTGAAMHQAINAVP